ncbi:MAG: HD-GYP domain-containing protein [Spirochaetaceae bacterium]|jgi:HD-GYP domain-containing protein (c-di-GMP phosphodiesterase class II)|nr:HD-GYP domain-containing protein [Spirochaetaceae bacterium]
MKKFAVNDIPAESFFSQPMYADENFIVATPEVPFSKDLRTALEAWRFTEVYSEGEPRDNSFAQNADIAKAAQRLLGADPANREILLRYANEFYRLFQKYTDELFSMASSEQELNFAAITDNVQTVCKVIKHDRRLLLLVQKNHEPEHEDNYQVAHAVKSMILSIMIGIMVKLTDQRLIELGVSALLHEIGMARVPPRLYLTKWTLTPEERKTILTHPILGYKLLKSSNFPTGVCLGALEHHERENTSGYPQKLSGDKISLYAKIIAVACSYEALTTHRPYKKAKDKHTALMDLLKNEEKQYDDTMVRALVASLSVYPIGLYVLLSNGKKGQVVDIDPTNPRFPVVQVSRTTIQTSQQLSVVRPLRKEEIIV